MSIVTPYTIQSNVKHPDYVDATIQACERAQRFKRSVAVFKDRSGDLHIQNVGDKSLRFFGRNGLLFVAAVA